MFYGPCRNDLLLLNIIFKVTSLQTETSKRLRQEEIVTQVFTKLDQQLI